MFDDNDEIDEICFVDILVVDVCVVEMVEKVESDDNDEWYKLLQMIFLKEVVFQLLDEFDELDDVNE